MKSRFPILSIFAIVGMLVVASCRKSPEVVVYTSVDQVFAEQIIARFTAQTGIRVRAVYDSEATKTTGLYQRLKAERARPQADVFWNGEICRTIELANDGLAEPIKELLPDGYPQQWVDPDGQWIALSLRCRVIIYNKEMVSEDQLPAGLEDLTQEKWRGKFAIADPRFGTTATHAAALCAKWGPEKSDDYFRRLMANGARVLPGNGTVRDVVARGELPIGLTDTDDVYAGIARGDKIGFILPDQQENGLGAFVIPNSIIRIPKGPNPEQAKKFIQFILDPQVEQFLAESEARQVPVRHDVPRPPELKAFDALKPMDVDYRKVAAAMAGTSRRMEEIVMMK